MKNVKNKVFFYFAYFMDVKKKKSFKNIKM